MDSCPFLSRNPDGEPAPDGGTTSLAPRDAHAGGVFGEAKFKTGAQSHCNRRLSHDWRELMGVGGAGCGGVSYSVPPCVPVTRAVMAQGPSVDLTGHGGVQCQD